MKNKWLLALALGIGLSFAAPREMMAQSTNGSNGGSILPGTSTRVKPNAAAGSPGSLPETSLSRSGAASPVTREGDVPNQIATLAPYAVGLGLILIGGLYFLIFRKSTTPEGDAAAKGSGS